MKYCKRCLYPENAKPTIIFDEEGVCSGCRYHESRDKLDIDWGERLEMLEEVLDEAKSLARQRGNSHDCIIPVSGGKDSQYQVWLLKEKYKMNPLLVTFNHCFNTPAGLHNLNSLVAKSGCDLIRFTAGLDSVRRISRYMLETVGDITWHYHAGIKTFPIQMAVRYNIPLIVWGEHGFAELTGLVSLEDFVEFTRWSRKEHDMRGYEPLDLVGKGGITEHDISPYIYPLDEEIEKCEVKGIYLSNFVDWNAKKHAELMIKKWNFGTISFERDRSFVQYAKIEDHANDVHDYLKYLKFGYGRATDDASIEIRHGRITREEGLKLVERYDAKEPSTLNSYCGFLGITRDEFFKFVEPMRDEAIWERESYGGWKVRDAIWRHKADKEVENARVKQVEDRAFSDKNRHLYYNLESPPEKIGEYALDVPSDMFKII
ncbi:MAG: N-acetyl sugar amidotransferase [Bacteroidetes bacterium]|nr:N-acetyl sugar amidotransferase [Bacteroidota bacterium]